MLCHTHVHTDTDTHTQKEKILILLQHKSCSPMGEKFKALSELLAYQLGSKNNSNQVTGG